MQTVWRPRPQV